MVDTQAAATPSKDQPRQLTYAELDILHALRGFCAFYVVVFHAKYILWSGGSEYLSAFPRAGWHWGDYLGFGTAMLSSAGHEMVIFFFVLSGFFIRYASRKKHRPTLKFYVNRIVRIYPPYLCSMGLALATIWGLAAYFPALLTTSLGRELNTSLLGAWQEFDLHKALAIGKALIFLKPGQYYLGYNTVYWSLLPEALFYLLVPLAFWRARAYYALSAIFFLAGFYASAKQLPLNELTGFLVLFNGYFALGSWLYDLVVDRPAVVAAFRRANGLLLLLASGLLLGGVLVLAIVHQSLLASPLAAVLAVVSMLALLAGRVDRQNILIRGFHQVGIFSFSLYLYHYPLLLVSYALLAKLTGSLIIYGHWYWLFIPVVVAVCYALYYATERVAVNYFRGI